MLTITSETGNLLIIQDMNVSKAGSYEFVFHAGELPPGKYFYQIELPRGNVLVRRSMIHIK